MERKVKNAAHVFVRCMRGVHKTDAGFFEELFLLACKELGEQPAFRVDAQLVSREHIRRLNESERGINRVTDVLSFPAREYSAPQLPADRDADKFLFDPAAGLYQLGDIVICMSVCGAQAKEYGHGVQREAGYLFVHGLLHLFGYDHEREDDKRLMREKEEKILARAGLNR